MGGYPRGDFCGGKGRLDNTFSNDSLSIIFFRMATPPKELISSSIN